LLDIHGVESRDAERAEAMHRGPCRLSGLNAAVFCAGTVNSAIPIEKSYESAHVEIPFSRQARDLRSKALGDVEDFLPNCLKM